MANPEQMEPKAKEVGEAHRETLAKRVIPERRATQEMPDHRAYRESKDLQGQMAKMALMVPMATTEPQAQGGFKDLQEPQVLMAIKVILARLGLQDQGDSLACEAQKAIRAIKVTLAKMALMAIRATPEQGDLLG